jgi:hypothetical protein
MSYADRVSSAQKPVCFGNANTFDPHDEECETCRFQHSCRADINRGRRSDSVSYSEPRRWDRSRSRRYRDDDDHDVEAEYESGIVGEHERPIERFLKDGAAGGLRGMFYEFYQFWKKYRIH